MKVLVTKASEDYWYQVREVNTFDDLMRIYPQVIVERNHYIIDEDFDFWDGMVAEDIPKIKSCEFHVIIYDDYVEQGASPIFICRSVLCQHTAFF